MIEAGTRYRNRSPIPVVIWWEPDAAALVRTGIEHHAAVLPSGQVFTLTDVDYEQKSVTCELLRGQQLLAELIPRKRQDRTLMLRMPSRYRVQIAMEDLTEHCDTVE